MDTTTMIRGCPPIARDDFRARVRYFPYKLGNAVDYSPISIILHCDVLKSVAERPDPGSRLIGSGSFARDCFFRVSGGTSGEAQYQSLEQNQLTAVTRVKLSGTRISFSDLLLNERFSSHERTIRRSFLVCLQHRFMGREIFRAKSGIMVEGAEQRLDAG